MHLKLLSQSTRQETEIQLYHLSLVRVYLLDQKLTRTAQPYKLVMIIVTRIA